MGVFPLSAKISGLGLSHDYGEPPVARVMDRDGYYRNNPEKLQSISSALIRLKKEHDFDLYIVIFSGNIGGDTLSLANGYQEAWLGEKNDGLIFLIDVQSFEFGETGRSDKLYGGGFIDEGLMPRIMLGDLRCLIFEAGKSLIDLRDPYERVETFALAVTKKFDERLSAGSALNESREHVNLMSVLLVGILMVTALIKVLSRVLVRLDQRADKLYRFPDISVGARLNASNGGGKMSWTSFGSPS